MDTSFLFISLFFPRLTLIVYYFSGLMPFNTVPFVADFILTGIAPRVLLLVYIYQNQGFSGWFWAHVFFMVLAGIFINSRRD